MIFREETITTTYKYSTELIDERTWGTWGKFLKAREYSHRYSAEEKRAKDTRRYGKCIVCKHPFNEEENIYFVQSVMKNSKCLGNLFACENCAHIYSGKTYVSAPTIEKGEE